MSLNYNIVPSAPAYPLRSRSSEKRAIAENDFYDAVEEAEQYLKNKQTNNMIDNKTWSVLCGIGWLTALVLVSIELFKDNRNNDWLWGAFISLLATLVIPFELWAVANWKWLSYFNTDGWKMVIRFLFILSTVLTVVFLGISLSRARVTNHSSQWNYIQGANVAYIISSVAGHEMKYIRLTEMPETKIIKTIKDVFIASAIVALFVVTGNHEVDYKKDKDDWVFTGTIIGLFVYLFGSVLRDWFHTEAEILRIVNVAASVTVLLGVSFLFGLYSDEAFRTANMLEHSGYYVVAFILVLVALVCDHIKHQVNKYFN